MTSEDEKQVLFCFFLIKKGFVTLSAVTTDYKSHLVQFFMAIKVILYYLPQIYAETQHQSLCRRIHQVRGMTRRTHTQCCAL